MTLTELRNHIDAIDDQLMTLLNERFALMQQVKLAKAEEGIALVDTHRETIILNKALAFNHAQAIQHVYRLLMTLSKELQQ